MKSSAQMVADAYDKAKKSGYTSEGAYRWARNAAVSLCPEAVEYLDPASGGAVPTVVYQFNDSSRCRVAFGGVTYDR